MAAHSFVTIDGKRHDVTGLVWSHERSCDRCGRYMATWTTVTVDRNILVDVTADIPVELCAACVGDHYPGLADLAHIVASRD